MLLASEHSNVVQFPVQPIKSTPPQEGENLPESLPENEPAQALFIEGIDEAIEEPTEPFHHEIPSELSQPVLRTRKTPEAGFRLIETSDTTLAMVVAAKTVRTGLDNHETVILISPESSEHIVRRLAMTGFDAEMVIHAEQLILLSSLPAISSGFSISASYREFFGELFMLAGVPVDRIVLMGMDLLVNLESQYQAQASVSKFTQAADEMGCKFIAQYTRNNTVEHDRFDAACSSLVNAYYSMSRSEEGNRYHLCAKNAFV